MRSQTRYRRSGDHQLLLFQLALTTVVLQRLGNVEAAARVAGQVDLPRDRPLLMPMFEAPFDDAVAALRIGLGADYDRLSQEGALMDVVDLLEFAIAALRPSG